MTGRLGRAGLGAAAFLLAVIVRLVPMLRGGGLRGYGSYDDSVYYASAVGLVHGRLPYRDFLLLQPPGIVLILAPVAAIGRLIGEADGLALGRIVWMGMGGLTTVGIVLLLYPLGRAAAAAGAAVYALSWPAAMVERVTDLEAPQNLALIGALLLLRPGNRARSIRTESVRAGLAGLALGLSIGVKIWGVIPLAVLAGWLIIGRRIRQAIALLAGALVAGCAVYLPFFLSSPGPMWRMVVLDQLGRRRLHGGIERLEIVTGTTQLAHGQLGLPILAVAVTALAGAAVAGWLVPQFRPVVVIFVLQTVALALAPPAFVHYGALVAVPVAVLTGAAVSVLTRVIERIGPAGRRRVSRSLVAVVVVVGLAVLAYPQARATKEVSMPPRIARIIQRAGGCITFDSPSPALALGVIGRNLARGCPLVVDLGGESYQPTLRTATARAHDRAWQPYAVKYLTSGTIALIDRFGPGFGFSRATVATIRHWPMVAHHGRLQLRRPPH